MPLTEGGNIAQGFAVVYMDESGFESETLRRFGYAPIGKHLVSIVTTGKVKNEPASLVLCMKRWCLR